MQIIGPPGALPAVPDIAAALRVSAARLGHRPAVTVLRDTRRDEQGFASLLQWTAKGAHLLELEELLEPGDRVRVDLPAGWPAAAVCFAAWWAGLAVTPDGEATIAVVHEQRERPADVGEVFLVGDAVDGTPTRPPTGAAPLEAWALSVQTFPDQPPPTRARGDLDAVQIEGEVWTQAEVLEQASQWGLEGVLGLADEAPTRVWLPALVRPLLVGRPTVVLAGVGRDVAAAEGVTVWA